MLAEKKSEPVTVVTAPLARLTPRSQTFLAAGDAERRLRVVI